MAQQRALPTLVCTRTSAVLMAWAWLHFPSICPVIVAATAGAVVTAGLISSCASRCHRS